MREDTLPVGSDEDVCAPVRFEVGDGGHTHRRRVGPSPPGERRQSTVTAVELSDHRPWTRAGAVAVCGGAFRDGDHLVGEALCDQFADVDSLSAFVAALDGLNGFFAVGVERDDETLLGVDHVRSIPLVYAPDAGVVSDDPRVVTDRVDGASDPLAGREREAGLAAILDRLVADRRDATSLRAWNPVYPDRILRERGFLSDDRPPLSWTGDPDLRLVVHPRSGTPFDESALRANGDLLWALDK